MALEVLKANRNTYNVLGSAGPAHILQFDDKIDEKFANSAPFTVLLKRGLGKFTCKGWKVEWLTDEPFPHTDTLSGSHVAASGTLTVTKLEYWQVRDTGIELSSRKCFVVTAVDSGTGAGDLTVTWASTAPTGNIASGTTLIQTGSAFLEGSAYQDPRSTILQKDYNYGQYIRRTVGATEWQQLTAMRGGPDYPRQTRKLLQHHMRDRERAMLFNERSYVTSGTTPYGTMRGVIPFISTHVTASFGQMAVGTLNDELRVVADEAPDKDLKFFLFTSSQVRQWISECAESKEQLKTGATAFGVNITTFITGALKRPLRIVEHPEFTITSDLAAWGLLMAFDPESQKYVRFAGNGINLDTHLHRDLAPNNYKASLQVDEVRTAQSLIMKREEYCAIWRGITAAA